MQMNTSDVRYVRSRQKILRSARTLFLDKGYAINLEEVAAHAGVVKRTLYNHFESKRSLLEAVLEQEHEAFRRAEGDFRACDLPGLLQHYARLHRQYALTQNAVKFYRLIISDVSQFPDMAAQVYATGVGRLIDDIARDLQAGIEAGWVRDVNTRQMAERFYAALGGMTHRRAAAGLGFDSPDYQQRYLDDTVACFLELLTPR